MEEFTLVEDFAANAAQLYEGWLDSEIHCEFSGGAAARIEALEGADYMAGDDYIWGKNLILEPNKRIVQTWRTTEFPEDAPDSRLEIKFSPITLSGGKPGTRLTLTHSNVPEGDGEYYRQGWIDYYFSSMHAFFANPR